MTKEDFAEKYDRFYECELDREEFLKNLTETMIEFAKEKCREQKSICVSYVDCYKAEHGLYPDLNNAPFPKFE